MKETNETRDHHKNDGCELARAYVVIQEYSKIYSPKEALARGTAFPELYQPYRMKGKKGRY